MPYINAGERICRPNEVKEINIGDIVTVNDALIKIGGTLIEYPPLSLISEKCFKIIESPTWIDGYKIRGKENIVLHKPNTTVNGKIKVKDTETLPSYILEKLYQSDIEIRISDECYRIGYPILSLEDLPLVTVNKGTVHVCSDDPKILIPLLLLTYAVFYYISPSSEES